MSDRWRDGWQRERRQVARRVMPQMSRVWWALCVAWAWPLVAQASNVSAGVPTRVLADQVDGRTGLALTAEGAVKLYHGNLWLSADWLQLDQVLNEVRAEGNVVLKRGEDSLSAPRGRFNLDTQFGEFERTKYSFQREIYRLVDGVRQRRVLTASGSAEVVHLEGENQYRLDNASYTTCKGPDPDWYLRVRELSLDYDRQRGEGRRATLYFQDAPVGWVPWIDFPLNGGRQSGFLPPTIGSSSNTGVDVTVPYYLNLAPNYDATVAPRFMGRRGFLLGAETRYLTQGGAGKLSGEYIPRDELTETQRGVVSAKATQSFAGGWSSSLDFTQVSDKYYFADLSSRITSTSQATLNQQFVLGYGGLPWLSASLNVQRAQTLVGESPYDRLPQLAATVTQPDLPGGFVFRMPTEFTDFRHPSKDEGRRFMADPQLSLPFVQPAGFVTPKVRVHTVHYEMERQTGGASSVGIGVPVFSLDSGLNFERETQWGAQSYVQTLEPRTFYVRAPYRDQTQLPIFDTARVDFNYAQLFSDNIYSGQDRVAGANQLTTAVTTRFIRSDTGEEDLRLALGQRLYFTDQQTLLNGEPPREGRVSDWLALGSGRVYRSWWFDSAYQYNERRGSAERGNLTLRYQPGASQVVSLSYRYQRQLLRDLDISAQWPLGGGFYGVGRYNYNMRDHKLTETIAGFEYKADCWVLRTVWQSLLNIKGVRNNAFFLQLELNGLASVGSSPVQLLKRTVSGYSKINDSSVGDAVFGVGSTE